ncbi:hypothetical protein JTB14_029519 [Gonioctena quinquepunctata]|nr:hypothetical protein JTB14_029519 [Gonioctena quinquepunctata]
MSTAKRLVLSWRGRKQSHDSSAGRLVGHRVGPLGDCHELDEIAVVSSNAEPGHLKYGSGTTLSTINGPRLVPGESCEYVHKAEVKNVPETPGLSRSNAVKGIV